MTYPILSDSPHQPVDELPGETGQKDIEEAVAEIRACMGFYDAAREYDSINLLEDLDMSREGRTLRQAGIEFDPNFCSVVIDSVTNRMEILSASATTGTAEDEAATEAATAVLAQVLDFNEWELYYRQWTRNSLRDGDGYICVWPDADYDMATNPTAVNITCVDGRSGRMFYDSENPRKKRFFAQMWQMNLPGERESRLRLNLYYNDRIEKYISVDRGGAKSKDFMPWQDDEEQWPVPNPWNEIPVFHLRTSLPFGRPEHTNAFALQDAISQLMEILMISAQFQAWPQRYALQEADSFGSQHIQEDPLADASSATDEQDAFPGLNLNQIQRDEWTSNETGTDYEASPGALALFKNFKSVGQFDAADPGKLLEPIRDAIKSIAATTDTPMHKFQGFGGNAPSGESLRIANAPLNRKVQNRMRTFGAAYKRALEFALLMAGVDGTVTLTWQNPEFEDTLDTWVLVEKKVSIGVPLQFALMQAGVPEDQAMEWAAMREGRASEPGQE